MIVEGYIVKDNHGLYFSGLSANSGFEFVSCITHAEIILNAERALSIAEVMKGELYSVKLNVGDTDLQDKAYEKAKGKCNRLCVTCNKLVCPTVKDIITKKGDK